MSTDKLLETLRLPPWTDPPPSPCETLLYDAYGVWISTPVEQERQRTARLAAQLKALGIEPEL